MLSGPHRGLPLQYPFRGRPVLRDGHFSPLGDPLLQKTLHHLLPGRLPENSLVHRYKKTSQFPLQGEHRPDLSQLGQPTSRVRMGKFRSQNRRIHPRHHAGRLHLSGDAMDVTCGLPPCIRHAQRIQRAA